ncbi:Hypothetical protein SRAE_2000520000 [Strongyloides ratti]|uniref:Uncharacterized protein n=1 Tax=Strongyloides ratti TaxID=34506 RepID=A0A090N0F0_STRRB|nr:Hypothetical protein SRAE_2000520000 [Strongyloides ratti]CEF70572.1 Hypothetical protein SRAE_2000520000 [Strongyloides ratti]
MANNTTQIPKIEPRIKIESIYLLFDSKTWSRKIIQLNVIFLLGILIYIFCFFYVIIVKKSNNYIYKYKPELVYEIRTEPTDEDTYNCIFLPEERLAHYSSANRRLITKSKPKKNKEYEFTTKSKLKKKEDENLKTGIEF